MLLAMLFFNSCATSHFSTDNVIRNAIELPQYFMVGTLSGTETSEPQANDGCRNPMVDPRDGTKLQLVRSNGDLGDYKVSNGLYGVGKNELLRLECSTGQAIGIVGK